VDVNDLYQADLVVMDKFAEYNDGWKYLMTVIDCFSRYAFAIPLKSKKPTEIVDAFAVVFKEYGIPLKVQTDNGGEYKNRNVNSFMKECGVILYFTRNDAIKASLVERFNRTLKERLWMYMTEENKFRYIDVLPSVVNSYNHTVHTSTGFAPAYVGLEESRVIRQNLLENQIHNTDSPSKFKIGDQVRISKQKQTFEKGFETNFTDEIFIIVEVTKSEDLSLYRIKDRSGEDIKGLFYDQELSKVIENDKGYHRISKILKTRKKNGKEQYLVRWSGFSSAFDSWEDKDNLK
jgi:Integrase core domain/Chromo (CHRromatin Organisation MOdifier) domain